MSETAPLVAVLMGSTSDWETMQHCSAQLTALGVPHECKAITAHLPGVLASLTARPVLGVPMKGWATEGLDALLSIAQMPGGVPVGTLAIGKAGAKNAAILAAQILGLADPAFDQAVRALREKQSHGAADLPPA